MFCQEQPNVVPHGTCGRIARKRLRWFGVLAFCLLVIPGLHAQTKKITATEAKGHIGAQATVCGKVASTHYARSSKGEPTFLNLDEPYPKEIFTILIWGSDRGKFGEPETEYKGLQVCVTGKIASYRGVPEIIATQRDQIEIQN
jgi:DNA/RNA endonuclease YhcR with UshA esterase domain